MNFKRYHVSKNLFSCNIEQGTISAEGVPRSADNRVRSDDFIIMETGEYTINALSESGILRLFIFEYMEDGTFVSRTPADWTNIPYTFSLTGKRKMKFIFSYIAENITPTMINSVMLNAGSTPQPYEPYSSEVWHNIPHYIMRTDTDTLTTLPADVYANDTTATVGLKGNMSQTGTGTTTIPSKSVVVQSLETGTNYAKFNIADFPNIAVGDKVTINVGGTNYSLAVKKVDSSYAYIENSEV